MSHGRVRSDWKELPADGIGADGEVRPLDLVPKTNKYGYCLLCILALLLCILLLPLHRLFDFFHSCYAHYPQSSYSAHSPALQTSTHSSSHSHADTDNRHTSRQPWRSVTLLQGTGPKTAHSPAAPPLPDLSQQALSHPRQRTHTHPSFIVPSPAIAIRPSLTRSLAPTVESIKTKAFGVGSRLKRTSARASNSAWVAQSR